MCKQDGTQYESILVDTRLTDSFLYFHGSSKKTKTPASMFLKVEYASWVLFLKKFASIFINFEIQSVLPRATPVDTLEDFDVSESIAAEFWKNLDIKKAKSPDGIASIFHKKIASTSSKSLNHFFYILKRRATFPEIWKNNLSLVQSTKKATKLRLRVIDQSHFWQ